VIRVVTLAKLDPADLTALTRTLYRAFGVGTEHAGDRDPPALPAGAKGRVDAVGLVAAAPPVRAFPDDKVLFLTDAQLSLPAGPLGEPPCHGFSQYDGRDAVVTLARLPARGVTESSIEAWRRRLARESIHFLGHLWGLHHCPDARCAMHPSWSQSLPAAPEADLCTFCREKSEERIRAAKT
jgi:predicted Zn-dependent protease